MISPWSLVHPRYAFFVAAGKPARFAGILLGLAVFLGLIGVTVFGGLMGLGALGYGPFVASAERERELSSILFGSAVAAVIALLLWFGLKKEWRNVFRQPIFVEGLVTSLKEDFDITDGGRGDFLVVIVKSSEYILPDHLKNVIKVGMRIRLAIWPGSGETRAVWVAS